MISLTCRGLNPKDRGRRERERGEESVIEET